MTAITIHVSGGALHYIHDDALTGLTEMGQATVRRASHVEPHADGGWIADMTPSGGGILGRFRLRQEALDAEREWLARERGL